MMARMKKGLRMITTYLVWSQVDGLCTGVSSGYMVLRVELVKGFEVEKSKIK
jgi:hypothetical protein